MGTVYPDLHQTVQHPLYDESLAYESYPPTADVNLIAPDPSGLNFYGVLPQASWTQWLSPQDPVFLTPASMGVPIISPHEQQYHSYGFSPDTTTQWDSPSTSMHSYPQPTPSAGSPNLAASTGDLDSRRGSTSKPPEKQKRKQNATPSTKAKSTRRASTKKTTRPEVFSEKPKPKPKPKSKPKPRSRKVKPVVEPAKEPSPEAEEEEEEEEEGPRYPSKRIQERNRVASNKFRVKKREDAQRLRVNEEDIERTNRDLSITVSDLTMQVYELKMKLLQHTDCECHLIQNYIANEAHRYIQDLGTGKETQMTPPIPPQYVLRR